MVHGGTGFPTESRTPESAEIIILMGQELPEQHRLMGFGVGRTIGNEPGMTVTLDIETADGQQQVSFWMAEDIGNRLGSFLANPPKP
jgi:hypothetical protein